MERSIPRARAISWLLTNGASTEAGETARIRAFQLSSEFKAAYPDQPWNMVAGLRHRLVHDYDGINWTIIVEVVFSDLDPFVDAVREILAGM